MNQPLLDQGKIFCTGDVNDGLMLEMIEALHVGREKHPKRPLVLYIHGNGGNTSIGFSVGDLIKADGNIWGIGLGRLGSCSGTMWASCSQRYIGPNTTLGVHQIYFQIEGEYAIRDLVVMRDDLQMQTEMAAAVYAEVSNKNAEFWFQELKNSPNAMRVFSSYDLIQMAMCKPLSELAADIGKSTLGV